MEGLCILTAVAHRVRTSLPSGCIIEYTFEKENGPSFRAQVGHDISRLSREKIYANFSREPATFFHAALRLVVVLRDASLPR